MQIKRYFRGVLATSSHCSILIETPLAGEASWENDLSVAPMGLNNSKFDQLGLCYVFREDSLLVCDWRKYLIGQSELNQPGSKFRQKMRRNFETFEKN
jgi:hypothetical protein